MRNFFYLITIFLFSSHYVYAFRHTLAFWHGGIRPIAIINSAGLGSTPSFSIDARNVTISGTGIFSYKAVVINSGTCTDPQVINDLNLASEQTILFPFSFTPPAETINSQFTVCAIGKNFAGVWQNINEPTFSSTLQIVTPKPVINSISLNGGTGSTTNSTIPVELLASDNHLNITHIYFKAASGNTVPSTPIANDSKWEPITSPSLNLNYDNFFTIGFNTTGTYKIYAWVKNTAGNISELGSSGMGSLGVDMGSINFTQGQPPSVINVIATKRDDPSSPMTSDDLTAESGTDVFIKWKITDDSSIPTQSIKLYYTTNDSTYSLISENLDNGINGACTIDDVTTYSGCYKWTSGSPASTYFKVRVLVTDASGLSAQASSVALNTSNFRFLAGNTDPGTGGSAASAIINTDVMEENTDVHSLVVTPSGKFFIQDSLRGLVSIDPQDGKLNIVLPLNTSTLSPDGPVSTNTLRSSMAQILLDFEGNLIIYDYSRIRKLNLSTNTITTLIGGGVSTDSGVLGPQLSVLCDTTATYCPINVLPNGDIYFFRTKAVYTAAGLTNDKTLYRYSNTDGRVYNIYPNGTFKTDNNISYNIRESSFTHFGIEFDPSVSSNNYIQRFYANFRRYPCVGCGDAHNPARLSTIDWQSFGTPYNALTIFASSFVQSMNGQLHSIPETGANNKGLYRLNRSSNAWEKILGGSTTSPVCTDGMDALSCKVYIQDAFITAAGKVYFLDNGLVRTIDEDNTVVTLFGQRKNFGDGGSALSARFHSLQSIDQTSDGKIVILDRMENTLREMTVGGQITKLADMNGGYWGADFQIHVNRDNNLNDVFVASSYTSAMRGILKWERATGNITQIVGGTGGGTTSYLTGDGLAGANIQAGAYPVQVMGIGGGKILGSIYTWNSGTGKYNNSYWKLFDMTDNFKQSHLAGQSEDLNTTPVFSVGTAVTNSAAPLGPSHTRGYWDADTNTWYFGSFSQGLRALPVGGTITQAFILPRSFSSWTMIKNSSNEWVIYYCSNGKIYKYNPLSIPNETALNAPVSSITCTGKAMFRSSRNSIVFPYSQNGLIGIAEIIDTP